MVGDRDFVNDVETTARMQAYVTSSPIYFYHFGYRGQSSVSELISMTNINWGKIINWCIIQETIMSHYLLVYLRFIILYNIGIFGYKLLNYHKSLLLYW